MNGLERKIFWEVLCSLEGEDKEEDYAKLEKTIIYPNKLYRYRPVSIKTIEALKNNKLYFSTANYYDDPFDTFINVRINEIRSELSKMKNTDASKLVNMASTLANAFEVPAVNKATIQKMISRIDDISGDVENYFRNIRNEIKKDVYSVCFSESPFNEELWLKYAEQHKGFVAEYDLTNMEKLICGKKEECKYCGVNLYGSRLFPVYYSENLYDATRFAQFLTVCSQMGINLTADRFEKLKDLFGNQNWEREKISLIKNVCHSYDEEWRMIMSEPMNTNQPVMREWIPSAIYIGLRMKPSEVALISSIARAAGVEKIYKCIISDDGKLAAIEITDRNQPSS